MGSISRGMVAGLLLVLILQPRPPAAGAATSRAPSAHDLLLASYKAILARGTAHVSGKVVTSVRKGAGSTDSLSGDLDLKHGTFHLTSSGKTVTSIQGVKHTMTTRVELILTGRYYASRITENGKALPWTCSKTSRPASQLNPSPANLAKYLSGLKTVGTASVNGISVWHVRGSSKQYISGLAPSVSTRDLYISRSDSTMVRITSTSRGSTEGTSTTTFDYSHYGESFHVSLPAACHA